MLLFIILWLIPTLLALFMVGYNVRMRWLKQQQLTLNECVVFFLGAVISLLPVVSIFPLIIGYVVARDEYDFGKRPLIVSQHRKNEEMAARLRGDC